MLPDTSKTLSVLSGDKTIYYRFFDFLNPLHGISSTNSTVVAAELSTGIVLKKRCILYVTDHNS